MPYEPDLFGFNTPPTPKPKQPDPPAERKHKPTFVKVGTETHFIHPCSVCGDPNAGFGYGVYLRTAIKTKDSSKAGTWFCGKHRPVK